MSRAHYICDACWSEAFPNRDPVRVTGHHAASCCYCGKASKGGIYTRDDPKDVACQGKTGIHEEGG